jgi:two-component system sensor histidine kinase ChiS
LFDLVMLDIEMAKTDGFEFLLGIRQLYALNELPITLLGDTEQTLDMAQGFSCGANDFIAIPCDDLELLARLQAQLDVGRLTQAEMTVMYLDIRDFSSIADNMTPKQNFDFLNEYLSYVISSIRAAGTEATQGGQSKTSAGTGKLSAELVLH